jgi:hypothetical protein
MNLVVITHVADAVGDGVVADLTKADKIIGSHGLSTGDATGQNQTPVRRRNRWNKNAGNRAGMQVEEMVVAVGLEPTTSRM